MLSVPISDIVTQTTVTPTAEPNLRPTIPVYERGPNDLAVMLDQDGFRSSNSICVKNLGCDLRFCLDPLADSAYDREDVTVQYAIVQVTAADAFQLIWKPEIEEVMQYKGLGYSSRLDQEVRDDKNELKQRVLKRGKFTMKYHDYRAQERFHSLYWSGSFTYDYAGYIDGVSAMDQNGQRVTGTSKVFLCLRSDTPAADASGYKVRVNGFMKAGYRNVS